MSEGKNNPGHEEKNDASISKMQTTETQGNEGPETATIQGLGSLSNRAVRGKVGKKNRAYHGRWGKKIFPWG